MKKIGGAEEDLPSQLSPSVPVFQGYLTLV